MPRDAFVPFWAAFEEKLRAGPLAFAWPPERKTLRQYAEEGTILHATSLDGLDIAIVPTDPRFSDPLFEEEPAEEGGGPNSVLDVWPELAGLLPHDGQLRAVATAGPPGAERHQVRLVDVETGELGPAVTVAPFGANGVH